MKGYYLFRKERFYDLGIMNLTNQWDRQKVYEAFNQMKHSPRLHTWLLLNDIGFARSRVFCCCSRIGQVLVYHDLLGMLQHPHHAKVTPKFSKHYARFGDVINKALLEYKEDVTNGSFADAKHSPYKISETDANGFLNEL
ncbi:unnamed protein product [Vicia faba]|uniref:3-methyl-2-oxobutanoate hydroxymethyltransferase n=1 Tax=Vicia faba TaxID=3906 RepID=A0AAV0ZDM6_VICFA|nr:unnamed protein product [Vicia faba]